MRLVLFVLFVLAAGPAVAIDGTFASADGTVRVSVVRAGGGLDVAFDGTGLGKTQTFALRPAPESHMLMEDAAPLGWFERMMGREAQRLPFDGKRLTFAHETADRLVLTTLIVDARGRPTMDRLELVATPPTALLEHQRFTRDGLKRFEPVLLEGEEP